MSDKWEEALRGTPATTITPASVPAMPAPSAVTPADPEAAATEEYQPWGREHVNVDDVIEVRRKTGEWRQVYRNYLVSVDGVGDTSLSLLGSSYTITLTGRHLGALRTLIKSRGVDFIQEFDGERWPKPSDGAPRIDRIEIDVIQARPLRSLAEGQARR